MTPDRSVEFFSRQFERQLQGHDFALNPFETAALPHLHGDVLDLGCGLGNLALAAARRGQRVSALDASALAVAHLRETAAREALPLQAQQVDLREHRIERRYDSVVAIGLLMFFDCATAQRRLDDIAAAVAPGGVVVINVLIDGTTYLDMFDPARYCLLARGAIRRPFEGWQIVSDEVAEFEAPHGTRKVFETVIARRPGAAPSAARAEAST